MTVCTGRTCIHAAAEDMREAADTTVKVRAADIMVKEKVAVITSMVKADAAEVTDMAKVMADAGIMETTKEDAAEAMDMERAKDADIMVSTMEAAAIKKNSTDNVADSGIRICRPARSV